MIMSVKTYLLVAYWWLKSLNDDKLIRRIQKHLCGENIKLPWKKEEKEEKRNEKKGRTKEGKKEGS